MEKAVGTIVMFKIRFCILDIDITCTLVFAQVQQEVCGGTGRSPTSPRPSVPQELYVALSTDIGIHHFLPVAAAA